MSQAHALGLMPRMLILHTNPDEKGQARAENRNGVRWGGVAAGLVTN